MTEILNQFSSSLFLQAKKTRDGSWLVEAIHRSGDKLVLVIPSEESSKIDREKEIEENIKLWEKFKQEYEFNKRWDVYKDIIRRVDSGHRE